MGRQTLPVNGRFRGPHPSLNFVECPLSTYCGRSVDDSFTPIRSFSGLLKAPKPDATSCRAKTGDIESDSRATAQSLSALKVPQNEDPRELDRKEGQPAVCSGLGR